MKKYIFYLMFLFALCGFIALYGCSKSPEQIKTEKEQVDKKIAADKAYDETHKIRPATDPSQCKNNTEGYLYFSKGKELFRSNKDSALIVDAMIPDFDGQEKPIINTSEIPMGCEGNPYKMDRVVLHRNPIKWRAAGLADLDIGLELLDVPRGDYDQLSFTLYSMKDFKWEHRNQIYREEVYGDNGDFICEYAAENLAHCEKKLLREKVPKSKVGLYVSNREVYKNIQNLPLVWDCDNWVVGIKCDVYYRLYPSLNISYYVKYKDPSILDVNKIILIDQHIREIYEDIRVKN